MIKISLYPVRSGTLIIRVALLIGISFVAAALISKEQYLLLMMSGWAIIFALFPMKVKIIFFILACFFPLSFGDFGVITTLWWVEWMAPLLFTITFLTHFRSEKSVFPREHSILLIAIGVLTIWASINYVMHPVSSEKLFGVGEDKGGLRGYFDIFVGLCVFFTALFMSQQKGFKMLWFLAIKTILVFSLILGMVRILSFYLGFDIPFVYGTFRFEVNFFESLYSGMAFRIGGLSEAAGAGIAALLALQYKKRYKIKHLTIAFIFAIFVILSGGRAFFVGTMIALAVYAFLIDHRKLAYLFVTSCVIVIGFGWLSHIDLFHGQINRLLALKGGLKHQTPYRWLAYIYMWDIFLEQPVFGKGIGFTTILPRSSNFIIDQLKAGGHGSYISIMSTFGIGGIFFLCTFLFYPLIQSIKILTGKKFIDPTLNPALVFLMIILTIMVFEYVVGGNGYTDMRLYFLSGIFAGLINTRKRPNAY